VKSPAAVRGFFYAGNKKNGAEQQLQSAFGNALKMFTLYRYSSGKAPDHLLHQVNTPWKTACFAGFYAISAS
jgi:hypothetical protein